jgi:outer membrane lipoprotein-sorting protein
MKGFVWAATLCATVVLAFPAWGQTPQEILERAKKKYDSLNDAELKFTQISKFPISRLEQHVSGLLQMKKGNRYRVETDEMVVVTDGETVWSYSRANNQVLIDHFKMDDRGFSPERILSAAPGDFTPTLIGRDRIGPYETYVLKLIPPGEPGFVRSMKLWISESDYLTRKVEMIDANGKETTYQVNDLRINAGLADARFSYTAPEGADVVDLR